MRLREFLHALAPSRRAPDHRPRLVRRAAIHCPHGDEPAVVDVLLGETGGPVLVLRCSAQPSCPPACDQACRTMAETVVGPARALFILPPGAGAPEEID